jgi:hypothetical protein
VPRQNHGEYGRQCRGYRVEEIENKLTQQISYLDKPVDELARGKALDKIKKVSSGACLAAL